jgi:hypothetical protein
MLYKKIQQMIKKSTCVFLVYINEYDNAEIYQISDRTNL